MDRQVEFDGYASFDVAPLSPEGEGLSSIYIDTHAPASGEGWRAKVFSPMQLLKHTHLA